MIPEVKNGQKITAELQNQIIEAVNGQMIPSEQPFVTTKSGPVFSNGPASTSSRPTLVPEELFHCMYATTYKISSRSSSGTEYDMTGDPRTKAWFVSLAPKEIVLDALQCNAELSIADFGMLGSTQQLDGKFESAWLNSQDWLDTGYDELSVEPYIAYVQEKKENAEDREEELDKNIYALLHNSNDIEQEKSRIKQLFDFNKDVKILKNGKLASYNSDTQVTRQLVTPILGKSFDSFDYNVVLKASLECIDVQKDSGGEVQSSTWAWKIPLGPDAECNEGKAHSSSVTYGGNEVVFEVEEEEEIGPGFSGDATYNEKAIWYGCYEAAAGEEVDADEVWLNLSYDYTDKAVKGTFSSTKDSGSYVQDGILSRNAFVVKLSSFKPGADTAKGDKAPAESLEHGTWGVLPKDGPKLDSYCKKDSQTEFKSLDWADRKGDIVSCECAQLYQFDQLDTVDPLSSDHVVIRRPLRDNAGAQLKYVSLSSIGMSSLSGQTLSADTEVSSFGLSSIAMLSVEDEDYKVMSLQEFDRLGPNVQFDLTSLVENQAQAQGNWQFVMKHVDENENKILEYMTLSALGLSSLEVSADNKVSGMHLSSMQISSISTDNGQQDILSLYDFDKTSPTKSVALSALVDDPQSTDKDWLVVKHNTADGNVLQYVSLSSLGISADVGTTVDVDAQYMASKFPHRYSIDWMPDADNDDKVLQMYRFDESPTNNQYLLRFDDDGQIPQNNISADFVIREYQADAGGVNTEVNYQDGKEVVVPHEVTDGERYAQTGNGHMSTNYAQGQQGEPKALQLYNFSSYSTTSDANGLSANGDGILIRKKSSGDNHLELQYLNIVGLNKLVSMPSLSALNGLSVVTGIEYPMTGTNQYKIVAHRKQINVVDNVLTITNLADQTIDTVAHDDIYPSN